MSVQQVMGLRLFREQTIVERRDDRILLGTLDLSHLIRPVKSACTQVLFGGQAERLAGAAEQPPGQAIHLNKMIGKPLRARSF